MSGYFVTGTDTEIGKTWASVALIHAFRTQGLTVTAMKPVAAGLDAPSDATLLAAACGRAIEAQWLNPLQFATPASPHLSARQEQREITLAPVLQAFASLQGSADRMIVEGVGGWMVPLSDRLMLPDLVKTLNLPVVLVVGLKLGCLNHALLSADKIQRDGCVLAGWIGNTVDQHMPLMEENIATLEAAINAPLLGIIPRVAKPEDGARYIDCTKL
ncbi:MAG: dethiobiotin synthase [Lysobacterales bacterium]